MGSPEEGVPVEINEKGRHVVPLLSIPFERPFVKNVKKQNSAMGKTNVESLNDDYNNNNNGARSVYVNSVIPSLMSLTLSPPLPPPSTNPYSRYSTKRVVPLPIPLRGGTVANSLPRSGVVVPLLRGSAAEKDDKLQIVEVERTNKTRREFAHVARDVTGANFEPDAGSRILFAYYTYPSGKKELIGVASFQEFNPFSSKASDREDFELFVYDYYNLIHYIFILRDFRGRGFGRRMVTEMEKRCQECNAMLLISSRTATRSGQQQQQQQRRRPVRVQAGTRAVAFFESLGYRRIGIGKDAVCSGTPLFRTLYNMTKML